VTRSPFPCNDIGSIGRSVSATELAIHLEGALRGWGFGRFEYLWFTRGVNDARIYGLGAEGRTALRSRLCLDPFIQHCRIAYTPVVWQSLSADASVRQVLTWSPWKGLPLRTHSGVAIPVHGPDGGFGLLNVSIASGRRDPVAADDVHRAHAAALAVYDTILANRDNPRFGLPSIAVDPGAMAVLLYENVEKARVLPAARH
jgi:hypothetical protein